MMVAHMQELFYKLHSLHLTKC